MKPQYIDIEIDKLTSSLKTLGAIHAGGQLMVINLSRLTRKNTNGES